MPAASDDGRIDYVGEELELFEAAVHWKRYWSSRFAEYVKGEVLDVGAGFGANTPYLVNASVTSYLAIEPDSRLCRSFGKRKSEGRIPSICELEQCTVSQLQGRQFDSILYIDVLEHIERDREQMSEAFHLLRPGGALCVLCPAHQFLFSPFDQAVGHFRRYDKASFAQLLPTRPTRLEYLDSVGLVASMANRLFLRQSYPSQSQVLLWDRTFVRASRWLDPLLRRSIGKSIAGVWRAS